MVDYNANLPSGLRPPLAGQRIRVTYRADLGAMVRVSDIARQLDDLQTVVSMGERWGVVVARAASAQALWNRAAREGPGSFVELAIEGGYPSRDVRALEEWFEFGAPWRGRYRYPFSSPDAVIAALADSRIPDQLGSNTRAQRMNYQNPLEVVLTGSGFLIGGVIYALRMVRDWSSTRRAEAAAADEAHAKASEAQAHADQAWSQAEILRFFLEEARAGRWNVPPGDLLGVVRPEDSAAASRLADNNVTLSLPEGLDPNPPAT